MRPVVGAVATCLTSVGRLAAAFYFGAAMTTETLTSNLEVRPVNGQDFAWGAAKIDRVINRPRFDTAI